MHDSRRYAATQAAAAGEGADREEGVSPATSREHSLEWRLIFLEHLKDNFELQTVKWKYFTFTLIVTNV